MKNKTIALMVLSVLLVVAVLGIASAATLASWNFEDNNTVVDSGTGTLTLSDGRAPTFPAGNAPSVVAAMSSTGWNAMGGYIEISLSTAGYEKLILKFDQRVSPTGPTEFEIEYSSDGTNFDSLLGSGTLTHNASTFTINPMHTFDFLTITSLNNKTNIKFRITVPSSGVGSNPAGTFVIDNLLIEGTAIPTAPPVTCDPGIYNLLNNNLRVKKIEFTNDGFSGTEFGKDDEWFPIDEITVEMTIENKGDEKIEDIEVEWGLYDPDKDQWVIEMDDEKQFDLKSGKNNILTVKFTLDDVDADLEDLDEGTYVFYVKATGYDNTGLGEDICVLNSKEADIIIESDFVVLNKITVPETALCGMDFLVSANVWNIGDDDQEGVYVNVYNKELKIDQDIEIGDVDAFSYEKLDATIAIPSNALAKTYGLVFSVYDEDDDVYQNDYDDDDSIFTIPVKVICTGEEASGTGDVMKVVVSASLESGGKAGQDLVIRSTITNLEDKSIIYTVSATGYTSWASSAKADQNTFTLAAGESKAVSFTFAVKDDAQGEQTFNIDVLSGGKLVTSQPVSVSIAKKGFSFPQFGGFNYIWAIAILNIILVIVIIIVAIKVMKK